MTFPIVNLNGTNGAELLDQIATALTAVRAARVALGGTIPHGRDYPTGFEAYNAAVSDHRNRCRAISDVTFELEEIAGNLADQIALRERQKRGVA